MKASALTLRDLFEIVRDIQATLDMAGAWEVTRRGRVPFQLRGSHVRLLVLGTDRKRIVDCSGAAWPARFRRLRVDLRKLASGVAYSVGVFAPESADAFEMRLTYDFPEWVEHFLVVSRTKTGAGLSMGYLDPLPADLDEGFFAAVRRVQAELAWRKTIDDGLERLLGHFHGDGASTVLHVATSPEERRESFRAARWKLERQLGAAAGTVLRPGGRVVFWRRGTGSVALSDDGPGPYFTLHVTCWREGDPPMVSPAAKRRWPWFWRRQA